MKNRYITKRNGDRCLFDENKILTAVRKAYEETVDAVVDEDLTKLYDIVQKVKKEVRDGENVENIQDLIEKRLYQSGLTKVARKYISYRDDRAKRRELGWQLDDLQQNIFNRKYVYGEENFEQWLDRVSGGNPRIRKLIRDKKFLFGGRILAHRGIGEKVTYSNCYVMPAPEDNIESIFDTAKFLARTYSYGGGCGLDISKLRPRNAKVNNSARFTTGGVSFMQLYDLTTTLIGQNGRRGALMISISDKHPDLEEFIGIKTKEGSITKANISIRISDEFMEAVKENREWKLEFVVEGTGEIIEKSIDAKHLLRMYCENNWDWAEPGNLFWSQIVHWHLMSAHPDHEYEGVNPCAEEPLMKYGSCLLGSDNLSEFVVHPFTSKAYFDFEKYGEAVAIAVEGLNEVLDEGMELHPLEGQRENARKWRQIGLGIMGLADMLIKMGIRYDSEIALQLSEKIARFQLNQALKASALLAKKDGPFPMYNEEALFASPFFIENVDDDVKALIKMYGLRNSQVLTIAPTGTISTMWGISGGIEPIFAISFKRKTESLFGKDVYFDVFVPIVQEVMNRFGGAKLPDYIVTSHDIHWKDRINMQSVWQKYIDASISSTVNLANETTVGDVMDLYMYAWEKKLKGVTIFRDGCKRNGVLTVDAGSTGNEDIEEEVTSAEDVPEMGATTSYSADDKFVTCHECGEPIKLITNGCAICMNCGASPCH